MRSLLCLLVGLSCLSLAQSLQTPAEVAAWVEGASGEVQLYAPALRSRPLAEALLRALREREVRVRLLTPYPRDPGSYFLGLSLAGAALFVVGDVRGPAVLWVDGRTLVVGSLVGGIGEPSENGPTRLERDPATLGQYGQWFDELRASARVFVPSRDLLGLFQRGR